MLELWGMQSTPSLPSLSGLLWSGVVAPDRVLSMGQIEQKLCTYAKLNCLIKNCFEKFKKMFIFIKMDSVLNNLQWLICHKLNQTKPINRWSRSFKNIFVFDRIAWNHTTKLFVLRIVIWSYHCLLRLIISNLKPFNCVQTNYIGSLASWVECSPMIRETWVQSSVMSFQRLEKWYLIPPCLTLSNIRYVSRVKWSNPGKGVAPSSTSWCSSYWKGSLLVALDYWVANLTLHLKMTLYRFLILAERLGKYVTLLLKSCLT